MSHRAENRRDAYTFSLGGLTAIASFVPAPAVAHDQIRQSPWRREQRTAQEKTAVRRQPEGEAMNVA